MSSSISKKLFICIVFLFFTACSMPDKPSVELGVLDVPAGEVIVGQTSNKNLQSSKDVVYHHIRAQMVERKPIITYDKAVCARPPEWVKIRDYIDALERYIETSCER